MLFVLAATSPARIAPAVSAITACIWAWLGVVVAPDAPPPDLNQQHDAVRRGPRCTVDRRGDAQDHVISRSHGTRMGARHRSSDLRTVERSLDAAAAAIYAGAIEPALLARVMWWHLPHVVTVDAKHLAGGTSPPMSASSFPDDTMA